MRLLRISESCDDRDTNGDCLLWTAGLSLFARRPRAWAYVLVLAACATKPEAPVGPESWLVPVEVGDGFPVARPLQPPPRSLPVASALTVGAAVGDVKYCPGFPPDDRDGDRVADGCDDCPDEYDPLQGSLFPSTGALITNLAESPTSVYATDLDGDGDADVLSASGWDDEVAWYENLGGGVFGAQQVITNLANYAQSVYATDLDGDGDADVLSASSNDDEVAWYENLGGGMFGAQQVITHSRGAEPGEHPRAALRVVRQHLPGAWRRVGRQGRRALAAADGRHADARGRKGRGAGTMTSRPWDRSPACACSSSKRSARRRSAA